VYDLDSKQEEKQVLDITVSGIERPSLGRCDLGENVANPLGKGWCDTCRCEMIGLPLSRPLIIPNRHDSIV